MPVRLRLPQVTGICRLGSEGFPIWIPEAEAVVNGGSGTTVGVRSRGVDGPVSIEQPDIKIDMQTRRRLIFFIKSRALMAVFSAAASG